MMGRPPGRGVRDGTAARGRAGADGKGREDVIASCREPRNQFSSAFSTQIKLLVYRGACNRLDLQLEELLTATASWLAMMSINYPSTNR